MGRRRAHQEAFSLFAFQDIITSVTGVILLITLMLALELSQHEKLRDSPTQETDVAQPSASLESLDAQIESLKVSLHEGRDFAASVAQVSASDLSLIKNKLLAQLRALSADIQDIDKVVGNRSVTRDALDGMDTSDANDVLKELEQDITDIRKRLASMKNSNRVVYNPNSSAQKTAWLVDFTPTMIRVAKPANKVPPKEYRVGPGQSGLTQLTEWCQTRNKATEYFVLLIRPNTLSQYQLIRAKLEALGFDIGFDLLESNATVLDSTGKE